RCPRDWRRDVCAVQHLSRWRRRAAAAVRPAAPTVPGCSRRMTLAALNGLDEEGATRELLRCCGSTRWAREMAGARPFTSVEAVTAAADTIWTGLDRADWLEAFS